MKPKSSVRLPLLPSPSVVGSVPGASVMALLRASPATMVRPLLSLSMLLSGSPPLMTTRISPVGITTPTI